MGARQQLADALLEALGPTFAVIPDPRSIGELDPAKVGVIQLMRTKVAPTNHPGRLAQEFDVWLLDPFKSPEDGETHLDDNLDLVVEALDGMDWLLWTDATRGVHPDGHPGYNFTLTTESQIVP